MKRYAFVGAVQFSARCLDALLGSGANVVGILCPSESKFNADFADLGPVAAKHGHEVRRFTKIADEAEHLRSLRPDVVFVLGLSQILPPEVLKIPTLGCIGSHPALLPRNRGRHPLIWAIANGLPESGLSLLWLDEGVDSGDLWKQRSFPIGPDDDAGAVYERVCGLGAEMLREGVAELERGVISRAPQDSSRANYWRKRSAKDGEIDWRMSSRRAYDLVRALRPPYGGAHCLQGGKEVKIWRARPVDAPDSRHYEPGRVLRTTPALTVKCGEGALEILESGIDAGTLKEGDYLA